MSLFKNIYDEIQLKTRINQILINQTVIMGALDAILNNLSKQYITDCIRESVKQTSKMMGVDIDENENS